MKNKFKLIIFCTLLSGILQAQSWKNSQKINGNGKVISEKRTTTSYDEIKIMGSFDVDLVAGKEGEITLEGEENLLAFVKIDVENNVLKLYNEKGKNLSPSKGKKIMVTVPFETLNAVSLSGSGDIKSKNKIKSQKFSVDLSGSGDLNLDTETSEIQANISGSGDIVLKGNTTNFTTKISGSGDIDASNLESKNADAYISGSGNIKVFCNDNLKARVSGSGDIFYKGEPQTKDTKVSGSGKIKKI